MGDLARTVLETALEVEMSEHLQYVECRSPGKNLGNSRNGSWPKSVLAEAGLVEVQVPLDRNGAFEPRVVRKHSRRRPGLDELLISLSAKGSTAGEVSAMFAEVCGAEVSKEAISKIARLGPSCDARLAGPAAGRGLPGGAHRRDGGVDPGRDGRQPAGALRDRR
jgi:putative transposase